MKIIGIYKITSPSNKVYVGQSVDVEKRFKTYLRYSCKSQPKLLASLKKHGSENHKYEIILICSKEELSSNEKYYVDLFGCFNSINGLNIRDGGGNSAKLSNEQKLKISNSLKGVRHSLERVEKNRLAQLNKKSSIEKRKREEMFPKVKKSRLGCTLTDTQKQHLRNINLGANNPNFGKQRTEESRGKTRESVTQYWKSKKLLCQKL